MITSLILGPILGYEWDAKSGQSFYTVIVRVPDGPAPVWHVDGKEIGTKPISQKLKDGSRVGRGEVAIEAFAVDSDGRLVDYSIKRDGASLKDASGDGNWNFFVPGGAMGAVPPRIVFCSCNGFSDPNTGRGITPLALWERMAAQHAKDPFSLLIMGGDQLYCDDLARREGSFARLWGWLTTGEKAKSKPSEKEFLEAYFDHYLLAWSRVKHGAEEYPHAAMIHMMARVPTIMIWDDHDIFDGWGSYQAAERKMPYYKVAFSAARTAFGVYQIRGEQSNRSLLDREVSQPRDYSQAVNFGPYSILVMDNRTNRTADRVMDAKQWDRIIEWLELPRTNFRTGVKTSLLVVSPVPVVYRRFYDWVSDLPGEHGGEDDLRDHWSHRLHEGERDRLVHHLFRALKSEVNPDGSFDRVTILSGDVHVGALGFLERTDAKAEIAQVISSGILHPPPTLLVWEGLKAISSDEDHSIQGQPVIAKMTRPVGAKERYLRCRNFVWLRGGDDGRLWVNWECERLDDTVPDLVEFGLR